MRPGPADLPGLAASRRRRRGLVEAPAASARNPAEPAIASRIGRFRVRTASDGTERSWVECSRSDEIGHRSGRWIGSSNEINLRTIEHRPGSSPARGTGVAIREELPLSTRVHELAKELGLKSHELLERIQK